MNLPITWSARATPLEPTAAAATGDAAIRLCAALLDRSDEALATLRGVGGRSVLAVIGAASDLPWVDGIAYAGRDPLAPSLLLPTHSSPNFPVDLLERALANAYGDMGSPRLLLAAPLRIFSLAAARPIARSVLVRWRDETP